MIYDTATGIYTIGFGEMCILLTLYTIIGFLIGLLVTRYNPYHVGDKVKTSKESE